MSLTRAQLIAAVNARVYENTDNEVSGQDVQDAFLLLINNLASLGSDQGNGSVPAYTSGSAYQVGQVAAVGGSILRQSHTGQFVSTDLEAEVLAGKWAILAGSNAYKVVSGRVIIMPNTQQVLIGDVQVAADGQLDVYTDGEFRVREGALTVEGTVSNNGTIIIE